ncbi:hypothetical protein LTR86_005718 [Recurvomyces mirabilis]|nr:hypothetical protein LTR86_005718 [Recurvomyces mirabilis]
MSSTIPVGSFFVGNLAMPSTTTSKGPATTAANKAAGSGGKLRAACDECRTKKLKCGGEQPICSRCTKEGIRCLYSPQKRMGRPKKRLRTDGDDVVGDSNAEGETGGALGGGGYETAWPANELISAIATRRGEEEAVDEVMVVEDVFTPNGTTLLPWTQSLEWSRPGEDIHGAVPGLTPDSSTSSPPTLNLPPELQNSSSHKSAATTAGQYTGSTHLLLDPFAAAEESDLNLGMPSNLLPTCACLSTLYLTLNNLQQMDTSFPFPFALHPVREAMQTATEVLSCPQCPTKFLSAIQNTQLAGTLLMSLAERFGKILASITTEAERADERGEEKKFRLADMNTTTSHLHTGGLGCAAAFSIDLSPSEWRKMCKKVVRAEVFGPADGNSCCPFLVGIIEQMEGRQEHWHDKDHSMPEDFPRDQNGGPLGGGNIPKEDHLCAYSRKVVEGFDWS